MSEKPEVRLQEVGSRAWLSCGEWRGGVRALSSPGKAQERPRAAQEQGLGGQEPLLPRPPL